MLSYEYYKIPVWTRKCRFRASATGNALSHCSQQKSLVVACTMRRCFYKNRTFMIHEMLNRMTNGENVTYPIDFVRRHSFVADGTVDSDLLSYWRPFNLPYFTRRRYETVIHCINSQMCGLLCSFITAISSVIIVIYLAIVLIKCMDFLSYIGNVLIASLFISRTIINSATTDDDLRLRKTLSYSHCHHRCSQIH